MQVLGIKFNSLSQNRQLKVNSENRNQNEVSNYQSYSYPSFGRYDLVSNTIKNSLDEMSKFPKDIEYRKNLMKNSGLNPEEYYKLRSIIGSEEIESIMKEFNDSEEFYSSGIDYNNVKNHKMRANLHMHTVDSDGTLTPDVLLDKASEYADDVVKNNPSAKNAPFVIAVTDHDTTGSAKELIKKVASNPEKYKNLRIILGVEMTTYNNVALDITKAPVNTHVLVYGIDPNEPTFDNFINSTKDKKLLIEKMMIDKTNKIYEQEYGKKDFFSLEESHNYFQPLKKNILGIYNYMAIYINTKYNLENVVLKDEKLKNLLEKNNLPTKTEDLLKDIQDFYYPLTHNNKPIKAKEAILSYLSKNTGLEKQAVENMYNEAREKVDLSVEKKLEESLDEYKCTETPKYDFMPNFKTLYNVLKNQKSAMIGLAHPLDATSKIKNPEDKFIFIDDFYSKFKENCREKAKFSEFYYQSYKEDRRQFQKEEATIRKLNELSEKYGLYKTGSQDTHCDNIFSRY